MSWLAWCRRAWLFSLVWALVACTGVEGTITLELVTAPDSEVMDPVVRARLTLSDPETVVEAERDANGRLSLGIDIEAQGGAGTVSFEGFDAAGDLVAFGRTPPVPLQSFEGEVTIYVAAPMGMDEAPVPLSPARADFGLARLTFGAALAGGRGADGTPSASFAIYNAYSHDFQVGLDMPTALADVTAIAGASNDVYLYGGVDQIGRESATAWRFVTSAQPAGQYIDFLPNEDHARTGARAAMVASETAIITGDPALRMDGIGGTVSPFASAPALTGTATSVIFDTVFRTLFVGAGNGTGGYVLEADQFIPLDHAGLRRMGHETVVLPDATALVLGGQIGSVFSLDGLVVDMQSREMTEYPGILATGRRDAAIAVTAEHVVAAGGLDEGGAVLGDAEILDARTLQPVAIVPMVVPRHGAQAVALGSGQVVIVGGLDNDGRPIPTIEIFTPAP